MSSGGSQRRLVDFLERVKREEEKDVPEAPSALLETLSLLSAKLEELENSVVRLEGSVEALEEALSSAQISREKAEARRSLERAPSWAEVLESRGFVSLARDLERLPPSERLKVLSELRARGAIELKMGDDVLYVDPRVYEELVSRLPETKTGDPIAVAESLGKASMLFNELFRRGMVFFDVREKKWRVI
ncbi:MAG: hypothetical protein QXU97_03600 [Fervidicoccaceae archaeon]